MPIVSKLDPLTAVRLAALRVKYRQQAAALPTIEPPMQPWTKYIKIIPTPKELEFLQLGCEEALYGGAAGGGKSVSLLAAALQYVDQPKYAAIIFRRTYADLSLPGALLDKAAEWLGATDAHWSGDEKTWHFPSGATLTFGYLDGPLDKYRYQSSEFQFIGHDELTQERENDYLYLFSRLRRLADSNIPLRVRSASNPGGVGHDWVKQRFLIEGETAGRAFIPARLSDNPYLDQVTYIQSLSRLDPITRQQLLDGNWDARHGGAMFRREWFGIVDVAPADCRKVRYWDLAATEAKPGKDPDWTVGALMGQKDGIYYLLDIRRMRGTPGQVESLIKQTAEVDGKSVVICMEEEPGSAGIGQIATYRKMLAGWNFKGIRNTGDKQTRAAPLASQAEGGNIKLIRASWLSDFLNELEQFPLGAHDDQTDASSGAFNYLASQNPPGVRFLG